MLFENFYVKLTIHKCYKFERRKLDNLVAVLHVDGKGGKTNFDECHYGKKKVKGENV